MQKECRAIKVQYVLLLILALCASVSGRTRRNVGVLPISGETLTCVTYSAWSGLVRPVDGQGCAVIVPGLLERYVAAAHLPNSCYTAACTTVAESWMTNAQRGLKAGDISEYIRLIERLYGVKVWYTPEYISNDWVPPMIISLERAGSATFADQLKDIVDAYNDFGPYVNGETSQGMYTPIAALLGTNIYLSGMRIFPQIIMDDMLMLCMSSVVILLGVYVYGAVRAGITKLMSKGE